MTNLTEQWKKGKLANGIYYVRLNHDSSTIDVYDCGVWWSDAWHEITEVLEEVPSYEEVVAMKDCLKLVWKAAEREVKLKKLLKECVELMGDGTTYMHIDVYRQRKKDVLNAISQVLGE